MPHLQVFGHNIQRLQTIEPWWGIADRDDADGELEHKYGMNHLEPGKEFQAGFSITYHSDADPE